jgi:AbrB family looped-hinge helix DNA binding protein
MERVKITAKGQITLPKQLRDKLKLKKGDYLEAFLRGEELVFKPLPEKAGKEVLLDYCKDQSASRIDLVKAREILARAPFSLSERVRSVREEQ